MESERERGLSLHPKSPPLAAEMALANASPLLVSP